MIKDSTKLQNAQASWQTVRNSQEIVASNIRWAFAHGGVQVKSLRILSHSLILVFAFAVLEEVLIQLRDEGVFSSKGSGLKQLMYGSRQNIPWIDFVTVDSGRELRNDVAHRQKLLSPAECMQCVDAIEQELINWKVLSGPVQGHSSIELSVAK